MKVKLGKEEFDINFTAEEMKTASKRGEYSRYMDDLGSVVIPKEFIEYFSFNCDEPINVCFTEKGVLLKPLFSDAQRKNDWVKKMIGKMNTDENTYTYSSFKNTVILTCFPPKSKELKTSYAFCAKQDKYDERVGIAVAYAKMMNYPIPRYI